MKGRERVIKRLFILFVFLVIDLFLKGLFCRLGLVLELLFEINEERETEVKVLREKVSGIVGFSYERMRNSRMLRVS